MKLSLQSTIGIALVALVLGVWGVVASTQHSQANVYTATNIGAATTSAAVTVTSSTRVLASTTNALGDGTSYTRVYASICNPSSTLVYLNLNQDKIASVPNGTVTTVIAAAAGYDACYEITDKNLYQGSIQASSTNQTSTNVFVSDYVQ